MQQIDANGFYDIYETWHIPFWQTTIFKIVVAGAALVLVSIALYFLWRWYRKKFAKPKFAWQIALEQIAQLQQQKYQTPQSAKQCYFDLTAIVKTYLKARYKYPLSSRTDSEMLKELKAHKSPDFVLESMQRLVNGALYVKFANRAAMREQLMQDLALCSSMIEQSIPQKSDSEQKSL